MRTAEIRSRLKGVKGDMAKCPAHEDGTASLSISTGADGRTVLHCHAGCTPEAVCAAIGLKLADLFAEPRRNGSKPELEATYDYRAEDGELLYQVVRFHPKDFRQRRPARHDDPPGKIRDGWVWSLSGVRRVLYRLPELLAAPLNKTIAIVEGEKDADRLHFFGLFATTCPAGAGKWRAEYSESLRGRSVIIIPDNDEPGRNHARQVAQSLHGVATRVKVLELPGLPPKADISDWLDAGHTVDELRRLAAETPEWDPEAEPAADLSEAESLADVAISVDSAPREPEPEDDEEPPPARAPEPPQNWYEIAPFRCLGYDHGTFFYLPRASGQVTGLSAGQHDRKTLLPLAPLSWWAQMFPSKQGVDWTVAADALIRASQRAGVFRPDLLRGRGCWPETDAKGATGILVHLGDRLLPAGGTAFVQPETYASPQRFLYERENRLEGPSMESLQLSDARAILELFQALFWIHPASAFLAAGWTALAPFSGALDWRPHIFLTGERGCGKSSILELLVTPLLADMVLPVLGQTTEAGIRQKLRADGLPVVFDEAEEGEDAGRRIQSVLALARQASSASAAQTLKGTIGGEALRFQVRSMFCLASIGGAVYQEADKSRISLLGLRGASQVPRDERQSHWKALAPKLRSSVSHEVGRRLIARTLGLLRSGMLPETLRVFRQAATAVLGEARTGDQYGTLYAGAWTLMADKAPTEGEARETVSAEDLMVYQEDHVPEGKKALQILMQQMERIDTKNGPKTVAVGELVDACCERIGTGVPGEDADAHLRRLGLRVDIKDGAYVLYVANQSEWIAGVLQDTIYSRSIRTVLHGLPGVGSEQIRFHPGLKCRASCIPIAVLD